ncbi:MAG: class I SAM-dependent methyltransferase [Clostridia bacterium]|nr:class I SAM-dependent methyltransferase [Clostridia bacterium]
MSTLYDRADIYDLIESDARTASIRHDWKTFLGNRPIRTLLDVSIGTGGMTLPLQELGISVSGSDLSKSMLARCRQKAEQKGCPVTLLQSDFRDLSCWSGNSFDCVASTGNALGYVDHDGVLKTLEQMDRLVRPGGFICFDSRNWEKIQREKKRFYLYNPFFKGDTRINLVQVWDHHADGTITFNLLYTFEQHNRIIQKELFEEHYHPFSKDLVLGKLAELGYTGTALSPVPSTIQETDFDRIDWYRVIAQKASDG